MKPDTKCNDEEMLVEAWHLVLVICELNKISIQNTGLTEDEEPNIL